MQTAKLKYRKEVWEVRSGMTVRSALEQVGLDPHSVLALRNRRLINDQTLIEPGDEIKLVNVISGG